MTKSKKSSADIIGFPDRRSVEREIKSVADIASSARSALDQAQELIYDAWETPDPIECIELAEEALKISPDCADAWVLLAEETAESPEQALEFYQKGVEAGERALGPESFNEYAGHFWGHLDTRPYMRARCGLAECLWAMGEHDTAISHYYAMLKLNPNDNQGIRYLLLTYLMSTSQYAAARELIKEYEGDVSADWAYTRALLVFIENGDSPASRMHRKTAITVNKYVPAYLSGRRKLPALAPEYIQIGDKSEAVSYVLENRDIWRVTPGAAVWLLKATSNKKSGKGRG